MSQSKHIETNKGFNKSDNYVVARKKLKDAEELSDINSGTEIEENLKKSRKIRAAKVIDESSNEESSDDEMALISQLPKFPNKHFMTAETTKKALKITKDAQKGLHCNENVLDASAEQSFDDEINNTNVLIRQRDETSNPLIDKQDLHCNENLLDASAEQSFDDEFNANVPIRLGNKTLNRLINKQDLHCNKKIVNSSAEQSFADEINANLPTGLKKISNPLINKQESENFQRFVIQKLISLELKINSIERCQKLILQKISIRTSQEEEKEIIDIFQDLPLKNENELQVMENKLNNDLPYRNQMVKQLAHVTCQDLKTSCVRIMKKMFTNELAVNFSWYGAKKKENFSKLHICKVIMAAARKLHTNATDEQISAPIKIWLAHAKERMQRQTLNLN